MSSNAGTRVLVTGGTGFISSWTIKYLLDDGYTVRATVRDVNSKKCDFIKALPGASERLELVAADLMSDKGWDEAVKGCEFVLHIASPYTLSVKDAQKDLVDPAVNGTLNVMRACQKCPDVKRVVQTSSVAAVSDCFDDWANHVYGPNDWNTTSSLSRNPYYFSKVLAEKAAFEFVEKDKPSFSLAVINPFVVYGPSLEKTGAVNQSVEMAYTIAMGKLPMNLPLHIGVIDVRDVAIAHIKAMVTPDAANKRFLLVAGSIPQYKLAEEIQKTVPASMKRKINTNPPMKLLPKWLAVLFARLTESKEVATYLDTNWGKDPKFDVSLARDVLKMEFRELATTIKDTVDWIVQREGKA